MKRTSQSSKRRAISSTTSTTGPHVRLEQNFGVAKVTTNGTSRAERVGHRVLEKRLVGRHPGRDLRGVAARRGERRGVARGSRVADVGLRVLLRHHDVPERLHLLLAPFGLGEQPVRARLGQPHVRDVDVRGVGLGASGHADPLELRLGLEERLRLQRSSHPDAGRRQRDDLAFGIDDEEGHADVARLVALRPRMNATSSPGARQSSSSVCPPPGSAFVDTSPPDPPQAARNKHDAAVSTAAGRICARV